MGIPYLLPVSQSHWIQVTLIYMRHYYSIIQLICIAILSYWKTKSKNQTLINRLLSNMATLNFPVGISQCILSMGIAHIEPSWNFSVTSGKVSLNLSWDQVKGTYPLFWVDSPLYTLFNKWNKLKWAQNTVSTLFYTFVKLFTIFENNFGRWPIDLVSTPANEYHFASMSTKNYFRNGRFRFFIKSEISQ